MSRTVKSYQAPTAVSIELCTEKGYAVIIDSLEVGGGGSDDDFGGRGVRRWTYAPWDEPEDDEAM
ncbi:MAG: hypothetical protein MJZ54_03590 [Bacteroidaceae bacterium]|nr:hypothetical protein [Bacteroidaceae bacterium]